MNEWTKPFMSSSAKNTAQQCASIIPPCLRQPPAAASAWYKQHKHGGTSPCMLRCNESPSVSLTILTSLFLDYTAAVLAINPTQSGGYTTIHVLGSRFTTISPKAELAKLTTSTFFFIYINLYSAFKTYRTKQTVHFLCQCAVMTSPLSLDWTIHCLSTEGCSMTGWFPWINNYNTPAAFLNFTQLKWSRHFIKYPRS